MLVPPTELDLSLPFLYLLIVDQDNRRIFGPVYTDVVELAELIVTLRKLGISKNARELVERHFGNVPNFRRWCMTLTDQTPHLN